MGRQSGAARTVVEVSPLRGPDGRRTNVRVGPGEHEITTIYLDACGDGALRKLLKPVSAAGQIARSDVVFSSDAHVTLGTALLMGLLGLRTPHVSFMFNLVNRRRFHPTIDWIARLALRKVTFFLTPSDEERMVFSQQYRIPLERFGFEHWGMEPLAAPDPGDRPDGLDRLKPYFCAIGRNNRDFATFAEALRGTEYNGIIVAGAGMFAPEQAPPNVTVLTDVGYGACLHIIRESIANVVPIKDPSIGAGHITMVLAMHMGVPQIVTSVAVTRDYFVAGEHGCGARPGDPEDMRRAMDYLFGNECERRRMGERARVYARRWLSGSYHDQTIERVLSAVQGNGAFPVHPPGWERIEPADVTTRFARGG